VNKPAAGLRRLFPNTVHVFEDLDKEGLVSRKRTKKRRKRNTRTPWRGIHRRVSEAALTAYVDPRNTSRECSRCDLKMNRHKVASINIRRRYLEGREESQEAVFSHSNDPGEALKVELWVGVTPSGWSPVIWIPMKRSPEGREAKGRGLDIKPNET
jgi:putative transposase